MAAVDRGATTTVTVLVDRQWAWAQERSRARASCQVRFRGIRVIHSGQASSELLLLPVCVSDTLPPGRMLWALNSVAAFETVKLDE